VAIEFEKMQKELEKRGYPCILTTGVGIDPNMLVCSTKEASAMILEDKYGGGEIKISCKDLDKCADLVRQISFYYPKPKWMIRLEGRKIK